MTIPVIGVGAGGHARVIIEIIRSVGGYEIVGLLDNDLALKDQRVSDILVLGDDAVAEEMFRRGVCHFFVGVGSVGNNHLRRRVFELMCRYRLEPINAIHPTAITSPSARWAAGVTVMAGAIINANAILGQNVIVNSGAIIEHDCYLASHTHIASGACLAGGVSVGEDSHVGLGASIRQQIHIGQRAIIGAGAVVVDDVPDDTVVVGVPARVLSKSHYKNLMEPEH